MNNKKHLRVIGILLALITATSATATTMQFEYTFANGLVLTGELDGAVQSDDDTVFINSFGFVTFDNVPLGMIGLDEFISASDFDTDNPGTLQPLVSFSGALMDIFVCSEGFLEGNCHFPDDGGFYIHNGVNPAFDQNGASAATTLSGAIDSNFAVDRWSLTIVPVPAALPLMFMALTVLGFAARRH